MCVDPCQTTSKYIFVVLMVCFGVGNSFSYVAKIMYVPLSCERCWLHSIRFNRYFQSFGKNSAFTGLSANFIASEGWGHVRVLNVKVWFRMSRAIYYNYCDEPNQHSQSQSPILEVY